jgi:hypothetical protein
LYVRAMFEFWAKVPYTSLDPPGLERTQAPCVPPPRPLVPARAKPEPLLKLSSRLRVKRRTVNGDREMGRTPG